MIADIPLSGEHEEALVAVDNPKKVIPRNKCRRNIYPTGEDAWQQNSPDNGNPQECWSPLKQRKRSSWSFVTYKAIEVWAVARAWTFCTNLLSQVASAGPDFMGMISFGSGYSRI